MWERNVLLRRIVFVVAVTLSVNLKNAPHYGGAMPPSPVGDWLQLQRQRRAALRDFVTAAGSRLASLAPRRLLPQGQ